MSLIRSTLNTVLLASHITRFQNIKNVRHVKRWVGPTLRELRCRKEKLGPEEPQRRSDFIEWNYKAELYAFGKRLNEDFNITTLQTALTNRSYLIQEYQKQRELGVENPEISTNDNTRLIEKGAEAAGDYVDAYLRFSLPKVPEDGIKAFTDFLLSEETLAHISSHLGLKDIIFSEEYPPSNETLAKSLLAVIGALEDSSGTAKAFTFIRDFICTQLNQKDLSELWVIQNPTEYLKEVCKDLKLAEPEPRLIGELGRNTVLAAYHVAVYSNKQQIGHGFGEDIDTAIAMASLNALRSLFDIQDSRQPFDFSLEVEKLTKAKQSKRIQK